MAWSLLQSTAFSDGTANTTISATFTTANLSSGSKLIAAVSLGAASATTVSSVKDGAGNSFTLIADTGFLTNGDLTLWAMDTPAGDVGTKPTITATVSPGTGMSIIVEEVSGLAVGNTIGMVDGTPGHNNGNSATPTNVTYSSSAANEYLVACWGDPGNGDFYTIPAGYADDTAGVNFSFVANCTIAHKNSTGGSEATHFTQSGTQEWAQILVAFKLFGAVTANTSGFFRLIN